MIGTTDTADIFVRHQFFGGGDIWSNILYLIMFVVFMFFYPRIMIAQYLWKLEQSAKNIEKMTDHARTIVTKRVSKKPTRTLKNSIKQFQEFFSIQPVSLDPYGIVKKLDHMVDMQEERFDYFVNQIAPSHGAEAKEDIKMGLSGAVALHSVSKIVRHFVETVRKTKNLQLALMLQMQLPMIDRIAKALLAGTEALANGWPVGDSVGPLATAHLVGKSKMTEFEKDVMMGKKDIGGRTVYIMKAKGPGGRLGKIGKAVEKISKKQKLAKIITIDAAAKLEGEKTGSLAEGVGVAMGGIGVERTYIEDVAVKKRIPIDSVVVKMSQEEAIMPMRKDIMNAVPSVLKVVGERIKATPGKGAILVIGVGNTAGVGNSKAAAVEAEDLIQKNIRLMKKREESLKKKQKKRHKWIEFVMGG